MTQTLLRPGSCSQRVSACLQKLASYPGPTQLSVACSTEKWAEPGIFSHVSMTQSENCKNLLNYMQQAAFRVFSTDYALNAWCVRQSPPASQIHVRVVSYLVPWLFLLFWVQCAHTQLNPFYHPFDPDVTHVRKDTRPSPTFPYCKRRKTGQGLGMGLYRSYMSTETVPPQLRL